MRLFRKFFSFSISKRVTLVIIHLFLAALLIFNICLYYLHSKGPLLEQKILIIPKKSSVKFISQLLIENNVIRHQILFRFIGSFCNYIGYSLKSGEYKFNVAITPLQILRKIINNDFVIHKIRIPEQSCIYAILNKINEETTLLGNTNFDIPEGYILPSTYFYSYGEYKESLIEKMHKAISKILDEALKQLSPDSPIKTKKDILILASIVEKEVGNDGERARIAGVFINRLKKNMKLQADPTVIYAITCGKYDLGRPLLRKDLQIISPYNTYHIHGLPIGPISCPSKKSIFAVVKPEKTRDFYFVSNGNGGHYFAENLEDHNRNILLAKKNKKQ